MRKKLRVIILAALGLASFGVAFVGSSLLSPPPAPPQQADEDGGAEQLAIFPELDDRDQVVSAVMKERMLNELIQDVRQRIEACKKRQAELDQQEQRIGLAEEELRKQARELEALRVDLVAPLTRMREAIAELENTRIRISAEEQANVKRIAGVYERMDAASGGEMLERMCLADREEDAVKILRYMSERSAGRVLAEMADKELAARLCIMLTRVVEEG